MGNIEYRPETCVWELTTGCNLHCRHCASSCREEGRKDELSETEIKNAAEQIAELDVKWVSLTGGEVLTSDCWETAVSVLENHGVRVHMITNGTLLDETAVSRIAKLGVSMVSVSLEGTGKVHDFIRGEGVYERASKGLWWLREAGVRTGCITSVMKRNLADLGELKEELVRKGASLWQLQMAVPEGNMRLNRELLLEPWQMAELIDRAYELSQDGRLRILLPDNVGYYTRKETVLRQRGENGFRVWKGCGAGLRSFGLLSNGDVTGCTSLRGGIFTEGNIRVRPLREIWENPSCFSWRRNLAPDSLGIRCSKCRYAELCLGGCSNTRYTVQGSIFSDNPYCAYAVSGEMCRETGK